MAVVLVVVDTATAECVVTDNGESSAHMYYIQPTDADKTQAQKLDAVFCKCPWTFGNIIDRFNTFLSVVDSLDLLDTLCYVIK